MKKIIVFLLLTAMVLSLAPGIVWAEEPSETVTAAGFYGIQSTTEMTVSAKTSAGGIITSTSANVDGEDGYELFYPNSEKLEVQVSGTESGKQYLVLLVTGDDLPDSASQICYINQVQATSDTVNFTVYPMLPETSTEMTLFVTSNADEFTTMSVSLDYAAEGTYDVAPYTLGDVDDDNKIKPTDALAVLKHCVKMVTLQGSALSAADVDRDGVIKPTDALLILKYCVKLINEF